MALDLRAALRIQASVDGTASIKGLEQSLVSADKKASGLQGTFGKLSGALSALVPAAGIAGITVLAKKSIDAADNLNDLSQRTGVAVETLSRFGAAADDSGSSVDEVAKSMGRLARSVVDPASKANEALKSIGINSTDASGKVRSMDEIMLDLADRFAKMPDGAQKTALAMELFGRSGANLIPMLNQGRDAISKYAATITTEGAQAADKFNDSLNEIARALAGPFNKSVTALLPLITQMAQGITAGIQAFTSLPAPIQAIAGAVAGLTAGFVILAPAISAMISLIGLAGPALAAIGAAISGVAALLAGWAPVIVAVFTGPVGWTALLVAAGVAVYAFRDQIGAAFQAIGRVFVDAAKAFYDVFINPVVKAGLFLYNNLVAAFSKLAGALRAPFVSVATMIRGVLNGVLSGVFGAVNNAIYNINRLVQAANFISSRVRGPQLPQLPTLSVPQFAAGGVVSAPTMALVGEGGQREYIIPESKMARASVNYLSGARGASVIPAFANGGVVGNGSTTVQITTGPVLQQQGQRYVTIEDLEQSLQTLATSLLGNSRSAGGRRFQGVG